MLFLTHFLMHALLHERISACIAACTRAVPRAHRPPRISARTHACTSERTHVCTHAFLPPRLNARACACTRSSVLTLAPLPAPKPARPYARPALRPYACLPDRTSMHGSPPALTQAIKHVHRSIELAPRIVAAGYRCSCELAEQRASSSTTRTAYIASAIGALPLSRHLLQ